MSIETENKLTALLLLAALVGAAIALLRSLEFTAMVIKMLGG